MTIPDPARQQEFLRTMPNAIVATIRRSGLPQLTPNWYVWTGSEFWISTADWTVKTRNLRRDDRIVLCIDDPASGDYVQVVGTAVLIEGDAVREPTLELIRKYRAEADVIPHWDAINTEGDRVLIVVSPSRFQWHDR